MANAARGPAARPLETGDKGVEVQHLRKYLARFGYLESPCSCHDMLFCDHVGASVAEYQRLFHLPVTGRLDQATMEQMGKPRCGVPDLHIGNAPLLEVSSNFTLSGGKWDHNNLTYFFQNGTGDLSGTSEWDILRQAMDRWAAVTPLTFTQAANEANADIRFRWASGDHGDGSSFDGFGGVLAHAFFPPPVNQQPIAGDVHFDEAEEWDTEDGGWWFWKRIDLLTVAIHEIGHALGLRHSNVSGAVMWPSYEGENRTLQPDDIEGIQALYGPPIVPAGGAFAEASLWALKNTGGYGTVTIDLGRPRRFVAWGTVTMIDPLRDFDRDNAVVVEVFQVDDAETWRAVHGGAHWGPAGASSNVHQGAYVGFGQRVTFRLRSIHHQDLDAYGMGTIIALD